jgi:hypothetical protein
VDISSEERALAAMRWVVGAAMAMMLPGLLAAQEATPLTWHGDLRTGWYGVLSVAGDGERSDQHALRVRARPGATLTLGERAAVRARIAGRYATDQERFRFVLRDHATTPVGMAWGETTVDELHLALQPAERVALRLGRMQAAFPLIGVTGKSLSRNDSPNVDVTWTDGAHLAVGAPAGWTVHAIVDHNAPEGPTTTRRRPLDFTDSRIGYFLGAERRSGEGLVRQSFLHLTALPSALPVADGSDDYLAVTAGGALGWPVTASTDFVLTGEAGYAPNTHAPDAADGFAFQTTANFLGIGGRHDLGFVHGRIGRGWLLSPDLRPDNREWEVRYRTRFNRWVGGQARIRSRERLEMPAGAERRPRDVDAYLRLDLRW